MTGTLFSTKLLVGIPLEQRIIIEEQMQEDFINWKKLWKLFSGIGTAQPMGIWQILLGTYRLNSSGLDYLWLTPRTYKWLETWWTQTQKQGTVFPNVVCAPLVVCRMLVKDKNPCVHKWPNLRFKLPLHLNYKYNISAYIKQKDWKQNMY